MPSINKKCHQNHFLGVLEIIGCRLLYTLFELRELIDHLCRINTQVIYRVLVPDNFVTKHDITVTLGWQESTLFGLILYIPVNNFSVMSGWVFLWLSGRVIDLRSRGSWFKPHYRHYAVSLSKIHYCHSLVLFKPGKHLDTTETLLTGM